jgi:hypothetical protein
VNWNEFTLFVVPLILPLFIMCAQGITFQSQDYNQQVRFQFTIESIRLCLWIRQTAGMHVPNECWFLLLVRYFFSFFRFCTSASVVAFIYCTTIDLLTTKRYSCQFIDRICHAMLENYDVIYCNRTIGSASTIHLCPVCLMSSCLVIVFFHVNL